MCSIFDRVIVVEEDSLKVAVIVVNYFLDEKDNKKVLGITPILVNPKLINKGYGKKIIKYLIDIKGRIFDMLPDKMYAGIDVNNIRCKHLFEKLGFKLIDKQLIMISYIMNWKYNAEYIILPMHLVFIILLLKIMYWLFSF